MIRFEAKMREKEETPFGIDYLKKYQKENPECKKNHELLEKIFKEHATMKSELEREERISEIVYQRIKTDLDVSRVRSGATEKNSLIILEVLNTMLMTSSIDEAYLTDDYISTPLRLAIQKVDSDMKAKRTRKHSKINE